jgi:hypothetical protein
MKVTDMLRDIPAPTPQAPAAPRGKVNLAGLKKKGTGSKKDDTIYVPSNIIPPDLADETLVAMAASKDATGKEKELKGEILRAAKPWFFERFQGCEAPSSVVAMTNGADELTVAFKNDYRKRIDDINTVAAIIGPELASQHFDEKVTVTIDVEKIAEHRRQDFIDELVELANDIGCSDAIEVDSKWKPKAGFHQSRLGLGPAINTAIEQAFGGSSFTTSIAKRRKK